jgi:hypothetical protein
VVEAALISPSSAGREPLPRLIRLPDPQELDPLAVAGSTVAEAESAMAGEPKLLPPVPLPETPLEAVADASEPSATSDDSVLPTPDAPSESAAVGEPPVGDESASVVKQEAEAFEAPPTAEPLLTDVSPVAAGEPTGAMVSERAQQKIRQAYALARRGAYFAARRELVDVLRSLAEAKDQTSGAARRTTALANGLRALDEAEDFCPCGTDADAQLSVAVIASSHQTPEGKSPAAAKLLPQQVADLYLRYAQVQLGASVSGEPAGSMALHALGKIYSQLGEVEAEKAPLADRQGFALQHAALLARADNHLAAHELGVMLAESGHYVEAEYLLSQVAMREPHPVVLRNLARVQRKLGREDLAAATDRQAKSLASAGYPNVRWVPPQSLAQTTDSVPAEPTRIAAGPARSYAPAPMASRPVQPTYVR